MKKSIAIDARFVPGTVGGVQTYVEGLAKGFRELGDSSIRRFWLASDGKWLQDIIPKEDEIVICEAQHSSKVSFEFKVIDKRFTNHWLQNRKPDPRLPIQPIELDMLKPDIVHFSSQDAFLTKYASIYHPHDIQHIHYPEYFSTETIGWRSLAWPTFAGHSNYTVCGTQHVANDIEKYWQIPRTNLKVIPLGTEESAKKRVHQKRKRKIIFYPSAYYPHKNHVNLIYAVRNLIVDGYEIELHLSGGSESQVGKFRDLIYKLGLDNEIKEFGWVSNIELENLYLNSDLVVVPTLYESASFPILEAQKYGVSVVCSDIEPLRAQVKDEKERFNPLDPDSISECIKLKIDNLDNGKTTVSTFRTWKDVCIDYLGLYQNIFTES